MAFCRVCNGHGHDRSHSLKYMTGHKLVTVVMTGQILGAGLPKQDWENAEEIDNFPTQNQYVISILPIIYPTPPIINSLSTGGQSPFHDPRINHFIGLWCPPGHDRSRGHFWTKWPVTETWPVTVTLQTLAFCSSNYCSIGYLLTLLKGADLQ